MLAACSSGNDTEAAAADAPASSSVADDATPSTTEVRSTAVTTTTVATTTTISTTTSATSTTTTTEAPPPTFSSQIVEIDDEIAARMAASWRPGCPVGLEDLRLIRLSHWNFALEPTEGELVVAASEAENVVTVFQRLFDAGFPIERMELVDLYAGDDDLSMAANNTSAFNCREIAWRPGVWSNHAYGLAVDINPLVNPYVGRGEVLPPEGALYVDRSVPVPGGIYDGDVVVQAFADVGWTWGGHWVNSKDYQHFDKR